MTPALIASLEGVRVARDDAVHVVGLHREVIESLASAWGAGEQLTIVDLLTLSALALALADWLPLRQHAAAHQQVRAWWQAGPVTEDALLVVHPEGAVVLPPEAAELLHVEHHEAAEMVRLLPELRGLIDILLEHTDPCGHWTH